MEEEKEAELSAEKLGLEVSAIAEGSEDEEDEGETAEEEEDEEREDETGGKLGETVKERSLLPIFLQGRVRLENDQMLFPAVE